jgi:pimeloyl-ACP methyl ester carboxylesterase
MTDPSTIERNERVRTRLGALRIRRIGAGPMTVLWPSMFVDSSTWDSLIPELDLDREYVLVDGPGLGRSDALLRRSTITEAADAAVDLLDGLGAAGPVDWVGNAFGGHVGYKLAAMPGVLRSLVAISAPVERITQAQRAQINLLLPLLRLAGPIAPVRDAVVGAMLTDASAHDERIRRIVVESLERPSRRSMTNALRSFILDRVDVTAELAAIGVPCLYIASDDRGDWSEDEALQAAARTPNATAVTVQRARTLIPLEQPAVVADHLRSFWASL